MIHDDEFDFSPDRTDSELSDAYQRFCARIEAARKHDLPRIGVNPFESVTEDQRQVAACYAIVPEDEMFCIHTAAVNAHNGFHRGAEDHRERAGYGGC